MPAQFQKMAEYNPGALKSFYETSVHILHAFRGAPFQPQSLEGLIGAVTNGSGADTIYHEVKDVLWDHTGFVASFALSMIFVVGMVIAALVLLFWKLLSNPKPVVWSHRAFIAVTVVGFVSFLLILTGTSLFGVTAKDAFRRIPRIRNTINNELEQVSLYAKNTQEQALNEIDSSLENLKQSDLPRKALDEIKDRVLNILQIDNIDVLHTDISKLSGLWDEVTDAINGPVKSTIAEVAAKLRKFKETVTNWQSMQGYDFSLFETNIQVLATLHSTDIIPKKSTKQVNKIASYLTATNVVTTDIIKSNLDRYVERALKASRDVLNVSLEVAKKHIPRKEIEESVREVVTQIDYYRDQVEEQLTDENISPVKDTAYSVLMAFMLPLLLVLIPLTVGLVIGVITEVYRLKRGRIQKRLNSVSRGFFLFVVVIVFLTASLLMLVTTAVFSVSYVGENMICDPLTRSVESEEEMMQMIDRQLQRNFESGGSLKEASILQFVQGCRENNSIIKILNKTELTTFDERRTGLLKYIDAQFNSVSNIHLDVKEISKITNFIFDAQLKTSLQDLTGEVSNMRKVLSKSFNPSLNGVKKIQKYLEKSNNKAEKRQVVESLEFLETKVRGLKPVLGKIDESISVLDGMNTNLEQLHKNMADVEKNVNAAVKQTVESLRTDTKEAIVSEVDRLMNEVGRCRPLYDIYEALVHELICKDTLRPLHGVWLSLGMCLFFYIPAVVVSCLFSRHLSAVDRQTQTGLWKNSMAMERM